MEHTPGPWAIHEDGKVLDINGIIVADVQTWPDYDNKPLIAAAPLMYDELGIISDLAHRAANGALKRPGKPVRVSDLNAMLRRIRDIASAAAAKGDA